jgi:hypothetical protein
MILRHLGTGQVEDWAPDFAALLLANGLGERIEPHAKATEPAPVELTPVVVEVAAVDKAELILSDVRTAMIAPAQHAIINNPRFRRGPKRAVQTASR